MSSDRKELLDRMVFMGPKEEAEKKKRILELRDDFVTQECLRRGWPTNTIELTLDQIFEIRELDGWKYPKENKHE